MKIKTFKGVFILLFLLLCVVTLYFSRSLIKPILFSLVLAYMLNPLVRIMTSKGLNRRLSVAICIALLMIATFLVMLYVIPGIIRDVLGILGNVNTYDDEVKKYIDKIGYDSLPSYLKNVLNDNLSKAQVFLVDYLNSFFRQLIDFTMELPTYILVPVFIYYFLADKEYFLGLIKKMIPLKARGKGVELGYQVNSIIGSFIVSQILLSLIIGVITFVILAVLKVKFPLIIALINGIANIIPYFGPIIGFIPAFFSAATDSMNKALIVAVVFLIIQQIEGNVIAPKIMSDSMGIHPVFIVIILLLGGKFFGGWGLVLSVPIAGIVKVTYNYVVRNLY
jgi:predicted PurR-regulated permease PerM